jgi:pyruvate,water dikinase
VEQHFGTPQDIEFALDSRRQPWLVQSRPITTLYPLPTGVPDPDVDLRVYFSANVFRGYFAPITPKGIQFFQLLGTSVYRRFGAQVVDPRAGPKALVQAGSRLYVDVTPVIRDRLGRQFFQTITRFGESRTSAVVGRLGSDPRLAPTNRSRAHTVARIGAALMRVGRRAPRCACSCRRFPHARGTCARSKRPPGWSCRPARTPWRD